MKIDKQDPFMWHRWFAWHPVAMDVSTTLWLETILRRAYGISNGKIMYEYWRLK